MPRSKTSAAPFQCLHLVFLYSHARIEVVFHKIFPYEICVDGNKEIYLLRCLTTRMEMMCPRSLEAMQNNGAGRYNPRLMRGHHS